MKKYKKLFSNELFLCFISFVVFVLLLLNACASNQLQAKTVLQLNAPAGKTEQLNSALTQKSTDLRKNLSSADYKIGPEDLLDIDTFQVQELKSSVRVSAQGYIKLPLADRIKAEGMTVSELESYIAKKLEPYVKEPVVSVFVKEYRSQQISVLGSVKTPSVYYATGQKYLLDMISLAGGLTPEASSVCTIQRTAANAPDGRESTEKIIIDLDELLLKGRFELNIPVFSGDVIQVQKGGIFFVDGAVRSPGEFQLKDKTTTFTQAISMAKGLDFDAIRSSSKIYRDNGTKERTIIPVNYDAILSGQATDIPIQEKDIIIVDSSDIKRLLGAITTSLGFGAFRVGGAVGRGL